MNTPADVVICATIALVIILTILGAGIAQPHIERWLEDRESDLHWRRRDHV